MKEKVIYKKSIIHNILLSAALLCGSANNVWGVENSKEFLINKITSEKKDVNNDSESLLISKLFSNTGYENVVDSVLNKKLGSEIKLHIIGNFKRIANAEELQYLSNLDLVHSDKNIEFFSSISNRLKLMVNEKSKELAKKYEDLTIFEETFDKALDLEEKNFLKQNDKIQEELQKKVNNYLSVKHSIHYDEVNIIRNQILENMHISGMRNVYSSQQLYNNNISALINKVDANKKINEGRKEIIEKELVDMFYSAENNEKMRVNKINTKFRTILEKQDNISTLRYDIRDIEDILSEHKINLKICLKYKYNLLLEHFNLS